MSDAQDRYDRAVADIRKGLTVAQGGDAAEGRANAAYRQMIREGTAPPIKRKYLDGKRLKKVR